MDKTINSVPSASKKRIVEVIDESTFFINTSEINLVLSKKEEI